MGLWLVWFSVINAFLVICLVLIATVRI
jgi:hypothetical protein